MEENRTLVMIIRKEELDYHDPFQISLTTDQLALLRWLNANDFVDGYFWISNNEDTIII